MSAMSSLAPVAALLALAAVPQVTPQPEPAKPAMPITGAVNIANRPEVVVVNDPVVDARQLGDWQVRLAGTARVALPPPGFLQAGRTYRLTWAGRAASGTYRIVAVRADGWIEAEPADGKPGEGRRWINPAAVAMFEGGEK